MSSALIGFRLASSRLNGKVDVAEKKGIYSARGNGYDKMCRTKLRSEIDDLRGRNSDDPEIAHRIQVHGAGHASGGDLVKRR